MGSSKDAILFLYVVVVFSDVCLLEKPTAASVTFPRKWGISQDWTRKKKCIHIVEACALWKYRDQFYKNFHSGFKKNMKLRTSRLQFLNVWHNLSYIGLLSSEIWIMKTGFKVSKLIRICNSTWLQFVLCKNWVKYFVIANDGVISFLYDISMFQVFTRKCFHEFSNICARVLSSSTSQSCSNSPTSKLLKKKVWSSRSSYTVKVQVIDIRLY